MAKKEKKSFLEIISTEYAWEGLLLLFLALVSMVLGALIIQGVNTSGESGLTVNENFFFIGEYPKLAAWVLIVLGAFSLILSVYPYVKPSAQEFRRISWPTKKVMLENTLITFGFILVLVVLFIGYDALLNQVIKLFSWLGGLMK